ncbi:MAG TPA: histidine kinase dimerization/phospho-acceptor domain-containing protein, partial [Geobacteraceae bacterium]|nr:histidine kinase dimerization/phospho-acceptor domain-containing protein [Geobacteraceae bacterium]
MRNKEEQKLTLEKIEILHTELAQHACELEIANCELEAFSYTVSHDLRVPLTVINGYCQLILESFGDQLGEQCKEYFQNICDQTIKTNQLIDALLRFSLLSHRVILHESIDLSGMAHEIVTRQVWAQSQRRVKFTFADGVVAKGDANLLRVVMENLLGNAWKYTAKEEEALIEFGTKEFNGKPAYFIRDNGVGFDMTHADKLFIPFQRLHGVEEFKGFGIG